MFTFELFMTVLVCFLKNKRASHPIKDETLVVPPYFIEISSSIFEISISLFDNAVFSANELKVIFGPLAPKLPSVFLTIRSSQRVTSFLLSSSLKLTPLFQSYFVLC